MISGPDGILAHLGAFHTGMKIAEMHGAAVQSQLEAIDRLVEAGKATVQQALQQAWRPYSRARRPCRRVRPTSSRRAWRPPIGWWRRARRPCSMRCSRAWRPYSRARRPCRRRGRPAAGHREAGGGGQGDSAAGGATGDAAWHGCLQEADAARHNVSAAGGPAGSPAQTGDMDRRLRRCQFGVGDGVNETRRL